MIEIIVNEENVNIQFSFSSDHGTSIAVLLTQNPCRKLKLLQNCIRSIPLLPNNLNEGQDLTM